jgi:hypothetical protein
MSAFGLQQTLQTHFFVADSVFIGILHITLHSSVRYRHSQRRHGENEMGFRTNLFLIGVGVEK